MSPLGDHTFKDSLLICKATQDKMDLTFCSLSSGICGLSVSPCYYVHVESVRRCRLHRIFKFVLQQKFGNNSSVITISALVIKHTCHFIPCIVSSVKIRIVCFKLKFEIQQITLSTILRRHQLSRWITDQISISAIYIYHGRDFIPICNLQFNTLLLLKVPTAVSSTNPCYRNKSLQTFVSLLCNLIWSPVQSLFALFNLVCSVCLYNGPMFVG